MSDLRARKHKSSPSSRPAFAPAFVGRFVGNTQAARHALVAQLLANLAFDVEAPDRNELESLLFGALERLEIRARQALTPGAPRRLPQRAVGMTPAYSAASTAAPARSMDSSS